MDNRPTIDFTSVLLNESGAPMEDLQDVPINPTTGQPDLSLRKGERVDLTLGRCAYHALLATFSDERIAGEKKFERAMLATRIKDANDAALTSDEVTEIKTCIGKAYNAFVVMRSYLLLDPAMADKYKR